MRAKKGWKGTLGHPVPDTTLSRSDGMEMHPDRCLSNLFPQMSLLGDFTIPTSYPSLSDFS